MLTTNRNLLIVADVLIVHRGFAEQQPKIVAGLVQGLLEGNRMVRDRPDAHLDVDRPRVQMDAATRRKTELAKVHLSNLPENLRVLLRRHRRRRQLRRDLSVGGLRLRQRADQGSDPMPSRFVDLKHLAGARQEPGIFKDQKIAIAPIRTGARGALETDPLLSKDIRFLFEPNSATLDMANQENLDNLDAIKRLLQVSPGSTMLLRGHVDNARVDEFRQQGGEAYVRRRRCARWSSARIARPKSEPLIERYKSTPSASISSAAAGKSRPGSDVGEEPPRRGPVVHDRVTRRSSSSNSLNRSNRLKPTPLAFEPECHTSIRKLHRRYGKPDGISPPRMMRRSLAAAAGALLLERPASSGPARAAAGRVIVVGAGFSGLAAAYELSRVGYEVTVVEARNRVGGRVLSFTDLVPGKIVEGGGELIGSNHPDVDGVRKQFKLEFLDVSEEDLEFPIMLDGKRLSGDESEALWEEIEKTFNTMSRTPRKVDADRPWTSPNADALDKRTLAQWITALDASPLCKQAMRRVDDGRQRRRPRVAELLGQPRHGQGRRAREGTGPSRRCIGARAATSSWRRSWRARLAGRASRRARRSAQLP